MEVEKRVNYTVILRDGMQIQRSRQKKEGP